MTFGTHPVCYGKWAIGGEQQRQETENIGWIFCLEGSIMTKFW